MASKLKGRVALITGGSGGIGAATALEFSREAAKGIGIHYSTSEARAEEVASEVRANGSEAIAMKADISVQEEASILVDEVMRAFGGLDILVCYAGYPFARDEWFMPFEEFSRDDLMRPLKVDLLGSVYCAQAAIPHLKESETGRIIFVSSTPALTGDVVGISYLLAKGGLLSLTKALARYLGPYNVHVNCLVLGSIDTEAMASLTEEERRELEEETVLRRMGTPNEIARKAVFLASADSAFLTGTTMVVDGGFTMR